jgi:hypothetical protein
VFLCGRNAILNIKEGILDVMKNWPRFGKEGNVDRSAALLEITNEIAR